MEVINDRLTAVFEGSGIRSIRQFATEAGIVCGTLTDTLHNGTEPRYTLLKKILLAHPDVSAEWLMRGEGPMYKSEAKKEVSDSNYAEGDNAQQHYTKTVVDSDTTQKAIETIEEQLRSQNGIIKYLVELLYS